MAQWEQRLLRASIWKLPAIAKLWRHALRDPAFFRKLEVLFRGYNAEVFRRGLFDHERLTFEAV
jgi:hypothetical protein